jgi:hypothetical protein
MEIRFEWKLSYQDQQEYRAYGPTNLRTIEKYSAAPSTLEYIGSWYNGTREEFEADILARQGGCRVTYREGARSYRWTAEEYDAFVAHLRARHAEDEKVTADYRTKYPDVDFGPVKTFVAPRPIYWDDDAHTWSVEPFYTLAGVQS